MFGDPALARQVDLVAHQDDGAVHPFLHPEPPDGGDGVVVSADVSHREDHHVGIYRQVLALPVRVLNMEADTHMHSVLMRHLKNILICYKMRLFQ